MPFFNNIHELINTLSWSKELLAEMFEKRRSFQYKYDHAVEILDEDKVAVLISRGIIRQNGLYIELDDQFLDFFEQVLEKSCCTDEAPEIFHTAICRYDLCRIPCNRN
jgi:hypothetical protein